MPKFRVCCVRTDTYIEYIDVRAPTGEDARKYVESVFATEGWNGIFGEEEGEYSECESVVSEVNEVPDHQASETSSAEPKRCSVCRQRLDIPGKGYMGRPPVCDDCLGRRS